jgi:hypothetical protein
LTESQEDGLISHSDIDTVSDYEVCEPGGKKEYELGKEPPANKKGLGLADGGGATRTPEKMYGVNPTQEFSQSPAKALRRNH